MKDYGCYSEESCDYPVYAKAVANAVKDGEVKQGILSVEQESESLLQRIRSKESVQHFAVTHSAHTQQENIMMQTFLQWEHVLLEKV